MRITTLLYSALVLTAAATAQPQEDRARIGLFGDYGIGLHAASFKQLPGIPNCCPEFQSTTGSGLFLGLTYATPLSTSLSLHLRAHYGMFSVGFDEPETQPVAGPDGALETATIRHTLDADFSQISVEPLIGYHLTPDLQLLGGVTAGFKISSTYEQKETLESPSTATFSNGLRTRNQANGDIPDASTLALGITIGATYDLALNADRTVFLSPEVLFTYSPIAVASGVSWNAHQLRAGLALSFIPPVDQDTLSELELYEFARAMTPPKKGAPGVPFASDITASGLSEEGRTTSLDNIRIEEFASYRVRPLLPYVFFSAGDAEIPVRYRKLGDEQVESFSEDNFYNLNAMLTYHHLLNIVGRRMRDNASSTITLTGCADPSDGANAETIAAARAASVKSYLVSTWGIDAGRIATEARGLPEQASKTDEADGRDENRRVEITSSNASLLAPVTSADTMRTFTPAGIRFAPSIDPRVPIASWTVFVSENGRIIRTFHGNDPIPANVDWRLEEQSRFIPREARDMEYLLVVRDSMGQVVPSATRNMQISQITLSDKARSGGTDKSIDRYSMILFGFDRSDLTPANQTLVDMIKGRLSTSSTAKVIGYTDRSGAEDYNQRLSEQRARTVATSLGLPATSAEGRGERLPLYDNATPEGRFYSRTVEVIVETPRR